MRHSAIVMTVGALLLAACGGVDEGSDRLTIVATTSIWGDVVSQIVGDHADVEVLVPRGADAHDYQPTPQQVAGLAEADLAVANGLGLEEGLHDVLESAQADGANVLELAPELDPIPFAGDEHGHADEEGEGHGHDDEEGEEHDHDDLDPHVWFDPQRVARASQLIAEALAAIDPSGDWLERAGAYSDELLRTDEELVETFSLIPSDNRKLVTNHEALGYLAHRYGLDIVGVVIPGGSTLSDPSSAELAELVHIIETEDVVAIFTETTQPARLAEAMAAEVGRDIAIVELYTESLGDPGTPADTLTGMLTEDARRIANALG